MKDYIDKHKYSIDIHSIIFLDNRRSMTDKNVNYDEWRHSSSSINPRITMNTNIVHHNNFFGKYLLALFLLC